MAAAGAAAAPEAGIGIAAVGSALGWLVIAAIAVVYRSLFYKQIKAAARWIDFTVSIPVIHKSISPFRKIAHGIDWCADFIDHLLAQGMLKTEKATVYLLHLMWNILVWTGREIADLAVTTEHALGLQRAADVPRLIAKITAPLTVAVRAAVRAAHAAELHADVIFGRARAGIDKLQRTLTKTITKAVAKVGARVGRIERGVSSRAWWKRHLTSTLGWAAITAIVGTALGRLGLRWLRCGNVKKAGRSVCNMRGDLLDDLLLGLTTLTIGLELVAFAEEMGEVVEDTAAFIGDRVT